jgi:hypothetical protein
MNRHQPMPDKERKMYRVEIKLGSIGEWQRRPWVCATREEAYRLGQDFVSRSTPIEWND